jgi:malate synthase
MEDVATAEIARSQLWQWIHNRASFDGTPITIDLYRRIKAEELGKLGGTSSGHLKEASEILDSLVEATKFIEFLTLPAYPRLE